MVKKYLTPIFAFIVLFICGAQWAVAQETITPQLQVAPRPYVIGGLPANDGDWPFIVALVYKGPPVSAGFHCGGSLIADNVVLTAAHCVDLASTDTIDVYVGSSSLIDFGDTGEVVGVDKVVIHEGWKSGSFDYDIALLFLEHPVELATVKLFPESMEPELISGATLSLAGWGIYDNDIQQISTELLSADMIYATKEECESANSESVAEWELCAGNLEGGKDACSGDSGGPLMVTLSGERYQVGIVSHGAAQCASPGRYSVYSRVSYYGEWIDRQIHQKIADFPVEDNALQNCILQQAEQMAWQELADVVELHCVNAGVTTLQGLEYYDSLVQLNLSQNSISDFDGLLGLINLEIVDLSNTGLTDLNVLANSEKLQSIYLSGNSELTCIDPEAGPYDFDTMAGSCLDLIRLLEFPDQAMKLCVDINAATHAVRFASELTSLHCFSQMGIVSIEGIDRFENLTNLGLSGNAVADLSLLSALPNLKDLSLNQISKSNWIDLPEMPQLSSLSAAGNDIKSLFFLSKLPALKNLDLSDNNIGKLWWAGQLTQLHSLKLANNQIHSIRPLKNIEELYLLDISNNKVRDLSPLKNQVAMEDLFVANNRISDLSPLKNLGELTYLDISGNNGITCVDPDAGPYAIYDLPENCFCMK